ncbi:MAG: NAD-dependent epimerase/dehydratase family protein [Candidatus Dormibacteraeota bacterium]|nr:NAD-dependent epimerase/dehydratase family protein [Candidatus Dormibacteraeota bacterium]
MPTQARLPRRVAVTGGAGFIGSHTVDRLVADGCAVLVIDDGSHLCGQPPPPGAEVVEADAGSAAAARSLELFAPEAVLHLASKGGVAVARRDPAEHLRRSVASSVGLFHAAVEAGARRIVTASSGGTVYGDPDQLPAGERRPPAPVSAYGAGKLSEEVYLGMLGRQRGLQVLALRYGNVYGPRQDGTGEAGLVAISCTRLAAGQPPVIYGDGLQTRDFIYVGDVADANLAALSSSRSGAVNVGTGRETSVRQVVETLVALSGRPVEIEYGPARGSEVRRVCLDVARARAWLGWSPSTPLAEGLRPTLSFFCNEGVR